MRSVNICKRKIDNQESPLSRARGRRAFLFDKKAHNLFYKIQILAVFVEKFFEKVFKRGR